MEDNSIQIFRLNKFYTEFIFFLNTICKGILIFIDEDTNKYYLRFCKKIDSILDAPELLSLKNENWKPFENIRISYLDIEWENGGNQICQNFLSLIEEHSLDFTETQDYLTDEDNKFFKSFSIYIKDYKNYKKNYEKNFEINSGIKMNSKISKQKAIELINGKISSFEEILKNATYQNRFDTIYAEVYYGTESLIENLFSEKEKNNFRINVSSHGFLVDSIIDYNKETNEYKEHIVSCISQLKVYKSTINNFWSDEYEKSPSRDIKTSICTKDIFIIHGHNEEMKQSVARLIEKLGLNPIILHEKPNKGKTIIEKFENHAEVNFAIALISADDKVLLKNEDKFVPRQNVIFEMGFFIGKLGRDRVVALYEENKKIEILTDYKGVLYIPYDIKGTWKYDLIKEFKEAGFVIDMNKII